MSLRVTWRLCRAVLTRCVAYWRNRWPRDIQLQMQMETLRTSSKRTKRSLEDLWDFVKIHFILQPIYTHKNLKPQRSFHAATSFMNTQHEFHQHNATILREDFIHSNIYKFSHDTNRKVDENNNQATYARFAEKPLTNYLSQHTARPSDRCIGTVLLVVWGQGSNAWQCWATRRNQPPSCKPRVVRTECTKPV